VQAFLEKSFIFYAFFQLTGRQHSMFRLSADGDCPLQTEGIRIFPGNGKTLLPGKQEGFPERKLFMMI